MTLRPLPVASVLATIATIAWLVFGGDGTLASADPDDAAQVELGRQIYAAQCASCHGANLEGEPNWQRRLADGGLPAPPHDATGHTWHHPDELLFDYTKRGGAAVVGGSFQSHMPGFEGQLTDDEIWAVIAFIKSTWPPVIRQRQKERSHG